MEQIMYLVGSLIYFAKFAALMISSALFVVAIMRSL